MHVRKEKGLDTSSIPRFIRRAGRLVLTFAKGPESGDRVVDSGKVSTLVASSASDLLDDATIDVKTTSGRSMLVVRRNRSAKGAPKTEKAPSRSRRTASPATAG
jgi:hypothetical protein